jgi:hypothetical protein
MVAVALAFASSSTAQQSILDDKVYASNPISIVNALQDFGYKASVDVDTDGDPMVRSKAAGTNYSIRFYACKDNTACRDIQFSSGYDKENGVSAEVIADWNATKLVGPALRDNENDPFLKFFVAGVDAMSRDSFERIIFRWEEALEAFHEQIDW